MDMSLFPRACHDKSLETGRYEGLTAYHRGRRRCRTFCTNLVRTVRAAIRKSCRSKAFSAWVHVKNHLLRTRRHVRSMTVQSNGWVPLQQSQLALLGYHVVRCSSVISCSELIILSSCETIGGVIMDLQSNVQIEHHLAHHIRVCPLLTGRSTWAWN